MPRCARALVTLLPVITASLLAGSGHAAAQPTDGRTSFSAAYFGELLLHPGMIAGAEYRLSETQVGSSQLALLAAANTGSYVHPRNHVGLMLDAEAGGRFTFSCGFLLEAFAGLGYLHTVLAAPLYEVSADGHVERHADLGRPSFMPVASIGLGWQLRTFAPFLRVQGFGQYPFNDHLLPHLALLLGARI